MADAAQELLIAGLSRGLTAGEVLVLHAWILEKDADLAETQRLNDQFVQSDPIAAQLAANNLFLKENAIALGVLNHSTVPVVMETETERLKTQRSRHEADKEAAKLDQAEAATPSFWTTEGGKASIPAIILAVTTVIGWILAGFFGWSSIPSASPIP